MTPAGNPSPRSRPARHRVAGPTALFFFATGVLAAGAVLPPGVAPAAGGQGRTTSQGALPNITAGGQTNWTSHNVDLYNRRYSPLDEVNTANVGQLAERWSVVVPAGVDVGEVTPLVVDGVMYFHAGASVVALDAETGESIWTLELDAGARNRVRGPTYGDGTLYVYNGSDLVAADARDRRAGRDVRRRRRPAGGRARPAAQVPGPLSADGRPHLARLPHHDAARLPRQHALRRLRAVGGPHPGRPRDRHRRDDRRDPLGLQHDPAAPAGRRLGDRQPDVGHGGQGRRRRLDPARDRRRARAALHQQRQPVAGLRRLRPPRDQPLHERHHRPRPRDRGAPLVLPGDPPRPVGLGPRDRPGAVRRHARRPDGQGRGRRRARTA